MTDKKPKQKPKQTPKKAPSRPKSIQERRKMVLENFQRVRGIFAKTTVEAHKIVKKGWFSNTLETRRESEIPAYFHIKLNRKVKRRLKAMQDKFESEMLALYGNKDLTEAEYKELMKKINDIEDRYKREAKAYAMAIVYAVRAIAGTDKKLEAKDYAKLNSVLDHVERMYSENVKYTKLIKDIYQDTLDAGEWRVICEYVDRFPYMLKVSADKDRIQYNANSFLLAILDQNQRVELVRRYHSIYRNTAKTQKLIEGMTEGLLLNIKQRELLIQEITSNPKYKTPEKKRKELEKIRAVARLVMIQVQRKMSGSFDINNAERFINPKSIFGLAVTAIGAMGTIANYLTWMNAGKKLHEKILIPFSKPWFLGSLAVTGLGYHMIGWGVRPGGIGLLDKWGSKPKRITNPFGVGPRAEKKDMYFTGLAELTANNSDIEDWLLEHRGFDALHGFYINRKFQHLAANTWVDRRKRELAKKMGKKVDYKRIKFDIVTDFINYLEKNDPESAKRFKRIAATKNRKMLGLQLIELLGISKELNIKNTRSFKNDLRTTSKFSRSKKQHTLHELLLHRQGVKPLPIYNPKRKAPKPLVKKSKPKK